MKTNQLKIIGLGRCIIGHMTNYTNLHFDNVKITHHYLIEPSD